MGKTEEEGIELGYEILIHVGTRVLNIYQLLSWGYEIDCWDYLRSLPI